MKFDLKKINKEITIIVIMVIGILLVIFFLLPYYQEIQNNKAALSEQKSELEYTLRNNQDISWLQEQAEEIEGHLANIDSHYVYRQNALDFITDLEEVANNAQLSNSQINIPANQIESGQTEIPIQLTAYGSFNNLLSYLQALEDIHYLIKIDNLIISTASNQGENGLKAQIDATTYWQ